MGNLVGAAVGNTVDGAEVGVIDGAKVGGIDGAKVGITLVGLLVGAIEGSGVGLPGTKEGLLVGDPGREVGTREGWDVSVMHTEAPGFEYVVPTQARHADAPLLGV